MYIFYRLTFKFSDSLEEKSNKRSNLEPLDMNLLFYSVSNSRNAKIEINM